MNHLSNWLSGIGLLIFVYLVLYNGNATVRIINGLSSAATNGIKALQGRE